MPNGGPTGITLPRLRELRLRRALTIRELAEQAEVATETITRIEHGRGTARQTTTRRLAKALGVEPHELMGTNEAAA